MVDGWKGVNRKEGREGKQGQVPSLHSIASHPFCAYHFQLKSGHELSLLPQSLTWAKTQGDMRIKMKLQTEKSFTH